ncbi:MAG: hypothetical protein B6D45_06355 [Ignavibacteriales bacterium UTCHB3]|nr:MAG: hypothetical protein B6D45_06355 [Ignavibacteriales bacterium UTCHB3]
MRYRLTIKSVLFCRLLFAGSVTAQQTPNKVNPGNKNLPQEKTNPQDTGVLPENASEKGAVLSIDTLHKIDTLLKIDTVVVIDTVWQQKASDTSSLWKYEPTIVVVDSSSNSLFSLNEMLNTINPLRQIGIFRFLLILLIVFLAFILSFLLRTVGRYMINKSEKYRKWGRFIPVVNWAMWLLTVYLVLRLVFVQTQLLFFLIFAILVTIVGVAAIPFMKNLLGRLFILSGNLFSTDDYIKTSVAKGFVKEIGWRNVTVYSDEGSTIFIPNSYFIDNSFENISRGKKEELVSLDFDFPANLEHTMVLTTLKEAAISNPFLFVEKEPEVFIKNVDFLNDRFTVRINMYLYDSAYIDELYDALNQSILKKLGPTINNGNDDGRTN